MTLEKINFSSHSSASRKPKDDRFAQQLMFFASEWYDNFTPKLNETFEMANKADTAATGTNQQQQQQAINNNGQQSLSRLATSAASISGQQSHTDVRVRDALMRLRQSMYENERLIATITANIEYTRTTIEAIQDSLEQTKVGLDTGQQNALEAIKEIRQTNRWSIIFCYIIPIILLLLIIYYVLKLFTII